MTASATPTLAPKVFISYSWSSAGHQEDVRNWAERLLSDGVDVVLDIYDLQEGHDKFHFMEQMVTDPKVTHVLVLCDKTYAEKADNRRAGAGTESQIISSEIYGKVAQSKFIPIVCSFDESREPHLPVFLKSRIFIDFSSPEAVNKNWDKLVRRLHGKPAFVKPQVGVIPTYLSAEVNTPANPASGKLSAVKQAFSSGSQFLKSHRQDFITTVLSVADSMRIRKDPGLSPQEFAAKVVDDSARLKDLRNLIVDWVLIESSRTATDDFQEAVLDVLEKLIEVKGRPANIGGWNDIWFVAHGLFAYETFLYIVAALLKSEAYDVLHEVLTCSYLKPEPDRYGNNSFTDFTSLYCVAEILQSALVEDGHRLFSSAAELFKRQADRRDLPFSSIIEADLLVLLMALISSEKDWYPQLLYYRSDRGFPFFLRAAQHRNFIRLAAITGEPNAENLRQTVKAGYERSGLGRSRDFWRVGSPLEMMNLGKLDTIK